MIIGVDAREIQNGVITGIGRSLTNFIHYFSNNDLKHKLALFSEKEIPLNLNRNCKKIVLSKCRKFLWDQWKLPRAIISENIDLHTFQTLLEDPYFASLRQYFATGRARLQLESQVFRSFELAHLRSQTKQAIQQSEGVYIKGANFFEILQIANVRRYHCFTVFSPTSEMLTGCLNGKGIFARLNPCQIGYTYHSEQQVETLLDMVQVQASD